MNRVIFLYTIIALTSCSTFKYQEPANIYTINRQIAGINSLEFVMKNGDLYKLRIESMNTDSISGFGSKESKDLNATVEFKGTLPLDSIDLILLEENNLGKGILIDVTAIIILVHWFNSFQGPNQPDLQEAHHAGSCPFIYSWNGERYLLEAEAFGTALGKALETETSSLLYGLTEDEKVLRLRITNERPETHYINTVRLSAVSHDPEAVPVLSDQDIPWPVYQSISPVRAEDHTGRDIKPLLICADGKYWESDLSQITINSTLRDQVEVSFVRPDDHPADGSLVLRLINTDLITSVYHGVFGFLGDETLPFLRQLEQAGPTTDLLQDWTQKCGLHVEIKKHDIWFEAGVIIPEANFVPFTRLIRLDFSDIKGDTVSLRISSLPDVWKIDAAAMDWTPVIPLDRQPVAFKSAKSNYGIDMSCLLSSEDQDYGVLFPGEYVEIIFERPMPIKKSNVSYIIHTRGYLHEWLNRQSEDSPLASLGHMFGGKKIDLLYHLMQHERLLLPPIYEDWKVKRRVSGPAR